MSRFVIGATWDDAPHLGKATKEALYSSYQPFQRDARTRGIPQLGAGAVYQIAESELKVDPFKIPLTWPHMFGGDTDAGAGPTACVWGAQDPKTKTLYIYDCFKRRQELGLNVAAIKARGDIPGVMDAAALILTPDDAEQLVAQYRKEGIRVVLPNKGNKSVETGIELVWQLMTQGRLKIFSTLSPIFGELRLYRRNERGTIVKKNDHLLDGLRYLVKSEMKRAEPLEDEPPAYVDPIERMDFNQADAWMR